MAEEQPLKQGMVGSRTHIYALDITPLKTASLLHPSKITLPAAPPEFTPADLEKLIARKGVVELYLDGERAAYIDARDLKAALQAEGKLSKPGALLEEVRAYGEKVTESAQKGVYAPGYRDYSKKAHPKAEFPHEERRPDGFWRRGSEGWGYLTEATPQQKPDFAQLLAQGTSAEIGGKAPLKATLPDDKQRSV